MKYKLNNNQVSQKVPKQHELSISLHINLEFEFDELADQPIMKSKFFMKPPSCDQQSLNREEIWEQYMRKRNPKRFRNSPESANDVRGSKKPSLN